MSGIIFLASSFFYYTITGEMIETLENFVKPERRSQKYGFLFNIYSFK